MLLHGAEVRQKVFLRSTKAGNARKVISEQYLRDDIPCCSQVCASCALKSVPNARGDVQAPVLAAQPDKYSSIGPHYVVVDTNVVLHAMDVLENVKAFRDIIVPQTVLDEVSNRSLPLYTRLRALISGHQKHACVFHNEFSCDTNCVRSAGEKVNDFNDRSIRRVAQWYNQHLEQVNKEKQKITVVLVTNDNNNCKIAKEMNIPAMTVSEYVKSCDSADELLDMVPEVGDGSYTASKAGKPSQKVVADVYNPYYSMQRILGGISAGSLHRSKINISPYNYLEATVSVAGYPKSLLIIGRENLNRAFDGDSVVVELLPKSEWRRPLTEMATEAEINKAADGESNQSGDDDNNNGNNARITTDEEQRLLAADAKRAQLAGDESKLMPTAKVVGIIKRNWRLYVAKIDAESVAAFPKETDAYRRILCRPMDRKIPRIRIRTRKPHDLVGKRIVVAVDDWTAQSRFPEGHFVRTLGDIEDKQAETEAILLEHDIEYRPFPNAALACLPSEGPNWKPGVNDPKFVDRRDLRDLLICSIDPPRCQDIDDALHAYQLPNGNYHVGVHIADVTHFVKAGTPLDHEGSQRGTSTYLVDKRIDMLPALLGTDLCSLRPNVERYAFSVLWELDEDANIISTDFTKSLIYSRRAFEYEEAQAQINDESQQDDLTKGMRILLKLSKKLKNARYSAGALNLASPEVRILTDSETSDPTSVEIKKPVDTNSLVEEFMLLANRTVAARIFESYPQTAMLRRHAAPPATNFEMLNDLLRLRNLPQIQLESSKAVADSLDKVVDPNDPFFNTLIRIMATRCMMSAEYFAAGSFSYPEFRHYGLAAEIYTHFTSPIRRYADIVAHRQLAAAIGYEHLHPSQISKENLDGIVDNINKRHRNAQLAGRASVDYYVGQMLKQSDSIQEAYITRAFINGLGVLIPKFGLESVIHIQDLCIPEDAKLDEENYRLTINAGKSGERTIGVFDKVRVQVSSIKNEVTGKRQVKITLV